MPKWLQAVMGVFAVVGVAFVAMLLKSSFSAFEKSCDTFAVMVVPAPSGKLFAQMENEICDGRTQLESVVWISTDASPRVGSRQWSVFRAPSAQRRGNDYTPLQLRLTWRQLRRQPRSAAPSMGWTTARARSSQSERAPPRRPHPETAASFGRLRSGVTGLDNPFVTTV